MVNVLLQETEYIDPTDNETADLLGTIISGSASIKSLLNTYIEAESSKLLNN